MFTEPTRLIQVNEKLKVSTTLNVRFYSTTVETRTLNNKVFKQKCLNNNPSLRNLVTTRIPDFLDLEAFI